MIYIVIVISNLSYRVLYCIFYCINWHVLVALLQGGKILDNALHKGFDVSALHKR